MASVSDLKAAIDALISEVSGKVVSELEEIKTLVAKPEPDLSEVLAKIDEAKAKLLGDVAAMSDAFAAEEPAEETEPLE